MPRFFTITGLAALALLAAAAFAQRMTPTVTLELPKSVAPNSEVKAKVKIVIPDGWHAYQNPPVKDYQIPLTIEAGDKTLKTFKVSYPEGEETMAAGEMSKVYNGTFTVPISFKAGSKVGSQTIKVKVGWQLCDQGSCQPPSSSVVTAKLNVAKPVKPKP